MIRISGSPPNKMSLKVSSEIISCSMNAESDTFSSEKVQLDEIEQFIDNLLDTSVEGIITGLDLRRPIYSATTAYGHFGKEHLPWEQIKKQPK